MFMNDATPTPANTTIIMMIPVSNNPNNALIMNRLKKGPTRITPVLYRNNMAPITPNVPSNAI